MTEKHEMKRIRFPVLTLLVLVGAASLQGCIEMAVVGAGAAVASAVDRRTTGAQVEDEAIELRAGNRVGERFGDKVHVNITSYNRSVLVTGEVPDDKAKAEIEKIVAGVANVRGVTNDLQVAGISSFSSRASDAGITGKVKARFLDANRFNPLLVKVVTEASVVYLMGLVTESEAAAAVDIARTTSGVRKVVKVFEYCKPSDAACAPRSGARPDEPKKKSGS
jgi:osmotically-inducible protein OsmY